MNVTNAYLAGKTVCKTSPLYQYDYGQLLRFIGIDLPEAYEVHFSNQPHGLATTQIGNADGVTIPDIYLTTGYPVYAWIYLHTGADDGETEYMVTIPVIPRASISNAPPTPVQQDAITEAIAALNAAVTDAETAIMHYPKIEGGVWYVWDVDSGEYASTGINATGPAGQDGSPGQDGQDGADGFSPTVTITDITNGHRVTVTDADGQHTFDVMDGEDGQDGAPGVGVPSGGTDGQMLVKDGSTDYATKWANAPSVPVTDVQVNGTSILSQGVANVPKASTNNLGAVKVSSTYGTQMLGTNSDVVGVVLATDNDIKGGVASYKTINPGRAHTTAFYGLAKAAGDTTQSSSSNAVGTYTEDARSKVSSMLTAPVSVSGSTPSITALPGIRYVCGEVSTLDITLPASGCVDIVFESGSTPTVLTITPPTGVTVKWANGFDPTSLEANTTYEINIKDGLGVAGSWT